jgi:peptide/nickel transport system substrate-binding protein
MSRELLDNVLSGIKACFEFILNLEHPIERKKMFNQKSSSKLSATLLALILGASVFMAGPAWAAKYVTDPTTGKVVTAPEYGGTLTYVFTGTLRGADSWFGWGAGMLVSGVIEKLGIGNWGIDRDVVNFHPLFIPELALTGALAESWETPDPLTYIFHIRQGVRWHNKAPMNGRELTAEDVEYNFHRLYGLGDFTAAGPSPHSIEEIKFPMESIAATDESTLVVKLKEPRLTALTDLLIHWAVYINPPEVIEQHGDVADWQNVVGTGPYELTDFIKGSSFTHTKNPDYWGHDEKYPENRLPYIDELKALIIKEEATYLAALRSGRVDYLGYIGGALKSLDQVESLQKTNPEIALHSYDVLARLNPAFNDRFESLTNDVRVRHAMQMALDLETINATYLGGAADWQPQGMIGTGVVGYNTPFEEWPEELKRYYSYDPAAAEALLDEAGYPRGADGIRFKLPFHLVAAGQRADLGYAELAVAYWAAIGVEAEMRNVDTPTGVAMANAHDWEGLLFGLTAGAYDYPPLVPLVAFQSEGWTPSGANDPVYDAMYEEVAAATTIEEQKRLAKEADMYAMAKHWVLWGPKAPNYAAIQPWIIGYNGEGQISRSGRSVEIFARLWIDQELKKAMGN